MKRRCLDWLWACAFGPIMALTGCSGAATSEATRSEEVEPSSILASALKQPSEYVGKSLVISGAFQGWSGSCKGSPPVSRQDWMLEQAGLCVYVHGPLPAGMQAMSAKGEAVVVSGVLKLTEQGVPYLEAGQ